MRILITLTKKDIIELNNCQKITIPLSLKKSGNITGIVIMAGGGKEKVKEIEE